MNKCHEFNAVKIPPHSLPLTVNKSFILSCIFGKKALNPSHVLYIYINGLLHRIEGNLFHLIRPLLPVVCNTVKVDALSLWKPPDECHAVLIMGINRSKI